jgi:hypothetical protein
MLLENLRNHTTQQTKEYEELQHAIDRVGAVLSKLNEVPPPLPTTLMHTELIVQEIAKRHKREQLMHIRNRFEPDMQLIAPHRQLVR